MLEQWLDGYLDAGQPARLEKYHRGNSWKQASRKIICYQQNQWRQDPAGVGYTRGRRGTHRHATPVGRSPTLNHSRDRGTRLGRERGRHGEGARAARMLHFPSCSPYFGEGHALPTTVSVVQWEKTQSRGFLGHSLLLLWDCWQRRRVGAGAVCR